MSDVEKARTSQTQLVHNIPNVASRPTKIANPGALGLFSFASTTFILSLYNVNARSIHTPNVVVGMACFSGGLAQFLAGMWEFPRGNIFGATAFTSYGAFWMSYATILIPGSGVLSAYTSADELSQALGIYLITCLFKVMGLKRLVSIGSLRRNLGLISLFVFLCVTFILLAVGAFNGSVSVTRAGGAFGIITAWIAYYCGLSDLLVKEESWFTLPLGNIG
ncbi:Gpr1 family protein [Boletus edulis BED1]|uniref:Gpr1 family protein n=1 Tax=Boletus edulis BED1 TaxID=1328754 RepID=A0AAD4G9U0_BOLED|nr:Gpr1 family protein [Boletus edulis BED1]